MVNTRGMSAKGNINTSISSSIVRNKNKIATTKRKHAHKSNKLKSKHARSSTVLVNMESVEIVPETNEKTDELVEETVSIFKKDISGKELFVRDIKTVKFKVNESSMALNETSKCRVNKASNVYR